MKIHCLIILIFFSLPARADFSQKTLQGVYKNYLQANYRRPQQGNWYLQETNRWLGKYSSTPGGVISLNLDYYLDIVAEHLQGGEGKVEFGQAPQKGKPYAYRVFDLQSLVYAESIGGSGHNRYQIWQNLDRLNLTLNNELINMVIGRQNLRFGSSKFASAMNIFNPFRLNDLDRDQQDGVDGLRIRIPTGDVAELDFGSVWGKGLSQDMSANYYGMKAHVGRWLTQVLMMKFENNSMAGLDLQWDSGSVAFWGEVGRYSMLKAKDFWKATTGFRIESDNGNSFSTEYHFDQSGSRSFYDYQSLGLAPKYLTTGIYPSGRQYLIPSINFNYQDRWYPALKVICNVGDGPCYWWPQIEYHLRTRHFFECGMIWAQVTGRQNVDSYYVNESYLSYRYFF